MKFGQMDSRLAHLTGIMLIQMFELPDSCIRRSKQTKKLNGAKDEFSKQIGISKQLWVII